MELSATAMTTAKNSAISSQQGTNSISINPPTSNNNTLVSTLRSPNGNDSLQSLMQKQQNTEVSILESSLFEPMIAAPVDNGNIDSKSGDKPNNTNDSMSIDKPQTIGGGSLEPDTLQSVSGDQQPHSQRVGSNLQDDKNHDNIIIPDRDCNDPIAETIEKLLDCVEAELLHPVFAASSQSSSLYVNDNSYNEITSFVTTINDEEIDDSKPKDIVTLRNLEVTPPPQVESEIVTTPDTKRRRKNKRSHSESTDDQPTTEGRSKRQRKQTQLFQVSSTKESRQTAKASTNPATNANARTVESTRKQSRQSTTKRAPLKPPTETPPAQQQFSQLPPDVIFYEKNDYLAIRNEENFFYLCQLTENVRVQKPHIRVRWLDTNDGGQTYHLTSHYDMVPQKSIIMPVIPNNLKGKRKGPQLFSLDDQVKESIMDRLKRSLHFSENEQ